MDKDLIKRIQSEYERITSFDNNTLQKLADKYNITLNQLLHIIDL